LEIRERPFPAYRHTARKTTRGHFSAARGALQRAADHDSAGSTFKGARGGCTGTRRRLLWHAAAAAACTGSGSGSGKQKTSLKINLCGGPPNTSTCARSADTEMVTGGLGGG